MAPAKRCLSGGTRLRQAQKTRIILLTIEGLEPSGTSLYTKARFAWPIHLFVRFVMETSGMQDR